MKNAVLVLLLTSFAGTAAAGGQGSFKGFYKAKQLSTTPEALARAEQNLRSVRVGMSEMEFLEAMKMEVLANKGKPFDARLDGYLPAASSLANAAALGQRHLVFGRVEADHDVPAFAVILRDRRVEAIERLEEKAGEPWLAREDGACPDAMLAEAAAVAPSLSAFAR